MSDAEDADARRAVAAHGSLIAALYGGDLETIEGARLCSNPWIEEPEWNHAGCLAVEDDATLDRLLARAAAYLGARSRATAVVLDPFSRPPSLGPLLVTRGFGEVFRHAGLIFPGSSALPEGVWPAGTELLETGSGERFPSLEIFASLFEQSFAETAGGELSTGYRQAFPAAMARPVAGVEVVHSLVEIDGEPAAVGSRATVDGVCGLYNLGVVPRFRRLGLGGAITLHRVAAARAAGAAVVYLLTEDPRVESAQCRRGFEKRFELAGWLAPPTAAPAGTESSVTSH